MSATLLFTVKYFNHRQRNDILRNETTRKGKTGTSRNVLLKSLKMEKQWAILPLQYSKIAWYFLACGTPIVVAAMLQTLDVLHIPDVGLMLVKKKVWLIRQYLQY